MLWQLPCLAVCLIFICTSWLTSVGTTIFIKSILSKLCLDSGNYFLLFHLFGQLSMFAAALHWIFSATILQNIMTYWQSNICTSLCTCWVRKFFPPLSYFLEHSLCLMFVGVSHCGGTLWTLLWWHILCDYSSNGVWNELQLNPHFDTSGSIISA